MKSFIEVALIVLGAVFTTLKICGVITWSWWLVTAPFYVPFVIAIIVLVLLIATVGTCVLAKFK